MPSKAPEKKAKRNRSFIMNYCKEFKRSKATKFLLRKEHSEATQAMLIFLRFGSLKTDKKKWLSPMEVQKRTGIKMCTQLMIIKRWRLRGYLIMKTKKDGRKE